MAQDSWPSPNHNTRNVTDAEYEKIAARFSDDGVWGDPTDTAACSAGTGLQVTVRAGVYASVRGHAWHSGTTDVTLTIASNTSGSTRTDRVVLRLDRSTWDVAAVVKQGTPGAGRPSLVRDEGDTGVYEIPLADVTVINNATSVTVTRKELYIGARVRPCTSSNRPTIAKLGELAYEIDTGKWIAHVDNSGTWATLYEDSGRLTLGGGFSTWEVTGSSVGRKRTGMVTLRFAAKRVSSTFSAADSDGSKICTVPSSLRPDIYHYFGAQFTNGASCRVEVRPDGEVWARYLSKDVPAGYNLTLTCTYPATL